MSQCIDYCYGSPARALCPDWTSDEFAFPTGDVFNGSGTRVRPTGRVFRGTRDGETRRKRRINIRNVKGRREKALFQNWAAPGKYFFILWVKCRDGKTMEPQHVPRNEETHDPTKERK